MAGYETPEVIKLVKKFHAAACTALDELEVWADFMRKNGEVDEATERAVNELKEAIEASGMERI